MFARPNLGEDSGPGDRARLGCGDGGGCCENAFGGGGCGVRDLAVAEAGVTGAGDLTDGAGERVDDAGDRID